MSNQIQATGAVKIRSLTGALTGSSGVVSSVPLGGANGVATLDSNGKVPVNQLPSSVMEYKGTWNAATNTPTLVNGTGDPGDVYICNVAGTTNFGAGPITFATGDWVVYNGSIWQKSGGGSGLYVPYSGATNDLNLGTHNIFTNNLFEGFTSVAASGTQIVLTVASTPYYLITGSGGQTIKLPDATTLPNGTAYIFNNNQSSGAITVNNNSNTLIVSIPSGGYCNLELIDNSIAAGSWDRHFQAPSNVSWSTNTFDYPGSITSATWNGNTIAINRGGTGATTAITALANLGGVPLTRLISTTAPLQGGGDLTADRTLSITQATTSTNGYLSSTDWNTFNTKVGGTATLNYLPKVTATGTSLTLGNSSISDDGTLVLVSSPNMTINSITNIGTTSGFPQLIVGSTGATQIRIQAYSSSYNSELQFCISPTSPFGRLQYNNSTNYLTTFSNSTPYTRLFSDGNFAIGTTLANNGFKLEVEGTTKISGQLTLGSTITNGTYTYTLPSATGTFLLGTGTNKQVAFFNGTSSVKGSTGFYYDEVNVFLGIGTDTPSAGVTVFTYTAATHFKAAGTAPAFTFSNTLTSPTYGAVFGLATNYNDFITGTVAGDMAIANQSTTAGAIVFGTGTSEKMRMTSSGTFSIGNTNSTYKLDVTGTGTFRAANGVNIIGPTGNPAYYTTDQSVNNSGKRWSFGHTGAASGFSSWDVYNQTDNITALSIAASGNVGIGTTSPSYQLDVQNGSSPSLRVRNGALGGSATLLLETANDFSGTCQTYIKCIGTTSNGTSQLVFATSRASGDATATEAMRITSGGGVVIGATTTGYKFEVNGGGSYTALFNQTGGNASYPAVTIQHNATSGTIYLEQFYAGATNVGSITTNGTITSYNVSSDYRLKEDFKEFNGLNKVLAIKTYDYKWKNSEDRMEGVIAHELAEVLPYAVINQKDGVKKDGTIIPQGVDYSKIVPVLVKAIQELKAEIDELKNK